MIWTTEKAIAKGKKDKVTFLVLGGAAYKFRFLQGMQSAIAHRREEQ
jgi:hypothetical protein